MSVRREQACCMVTILSAESLSAWNIVGRLSVSVEICKHINIRVFCFSCPNYIENIFSIVGNTNFCFSCENRYFRLYRMAFFVWVLFIRRLGFCSRCFFAKLLLTVASNCAELWAEMFPLLGAKLAARLARVSHFIWCFDSKFCDCSPLYICFTRREYLARPTSLFFDFPFPPLPYLTLTLP